MGQTVLEINGVLYDARTGDVVSNAPAAQPSAKPHIPHTSGVSVDGIKPKKPLSPTRHSNHAARTVHKSRTLMRTAVKKPVMDMVHLTPSKPTYESTIQSSASYSTHSQQASRMHRAQNASKHHTVQKFAKPVSVHTKITDLSVAPMPVANIPALAVATPTKPQPTTSRDFVSSQLAKTIEHTDAPAKNLKPKRRFVGTLKKSPLKGALAVVASLFLVGGLVTYFNLPSIEIALASKRAGITAKSPSDIPSNFALNRNIKTNNGIVTLEYSSRTDDRTISLTQQKLDTTTNSLEEDLVKQSGREYQKFEVGGLTLYLTGPGTADWVDGGMRYTVSGNTGLSTDQLASIAMSL